MAIINVSNPDVAALQSLGGFLQMYLFDRLKQHKEDQQSQALAEVLGSLNLGGQQPQGAAMNAPAFGSAPGALQAQAGLPTQQISGVPTQPPSVMDLYKAALSHPQASKNIESISSVLNNIASALSAERSHALAKDAHEHTVGQDYWKRGFEEKGQDWGQAKDQFVMDMDKAEFGLKVGKDARERAKHAADMRALATQEPHLERQAKLAIEKEEATIAKINAEAEALKYKGALTPKDAHALMIYEKWKRGEPITETEWQILQSMHSHVGESILEHAETNKWIEIQKKDLPSQQGRF